MRQRKCFFFIPPSLLTITTGTVIFKRSLVFNCLLHFMIQIASANFHFNCFCKVGRIIARLQQYACFFVLFFIKKKAKCQYFLCIYTLIKYFICNTVSVHAKSNQIIVLSARKKLKETADSELINLKIQYIFGIFPLPSPLSWSISH